MLNVMIINDDFKLCDDEPNVRFYVHDELNYMDKTKFLDLVNIKLTDDMDETNYMYLCPNLVMSVRNDILKFAVDGEKEYEIDKKTLLKFLHLGHIENVVTLRQVMQQETETCQA